MRNKTTDRPAKPVACATKATLRKKYFSAADKIISKTKWSFEQPCMEQLVKLEGILVGAAETSVYSG